MIFVGIDPGKCGAVAEIRVTATEVWPIPMNGDRYNLNNILGMLPAIGKCFAVIEQSQPMPKQGVKSCYTIGYGFGILEMALVANGIMYQTVRPNEWKRVMLNGVAKGDKKAMSIQAAKRLFPDVSLKRTERSRKDDDGFAEALLLAEFARRIYAGQ